MDLIYTDKTDSPLDLSPDRETAQPSPETVRHVPLAGRNPFISSHRHAAPYRNLEARLSELESENQRLHRLVAELLIKNQQLRLN